MDILNDSQKAMAAFILTTIGSLATWALTEFPDSESVQNVAGLITAVLTILATTYGVWKTTNGTPRFQVPPAPAFPEPIPPADEQPYPPAETQLPTEPSA